MSRKRKPIQLPIAEATEAVVWRARILCEMLEGQEQPKQMLEPIKRMEMALEDYAASKRPRQETMKPYTIYPDKCDEDSLPFAELQS